MSDRIGFAISAARFISVYESKGERPSGDPDFHVAWPAEETPAELVDFVIQKRSEKWGVDTARSTRRPVVSEVNGRYGRLRELFEEADLRNVSRDRFLLGNAMTVIVSPWQFYVKRERRTAIGLGITEIVLDVDRLAFLPNEVAFPEASE